MFLFLNNYFLRGPCFRCPFRALNSVADLRLGDFWGPLYAKDKLGVSLILVLSEKARQLLVNTHDILLESQPLSESLIKHSQLMSIEKPKDYDIVLKELVDTMDLEHLMRSRFSWKIVKTRNHAWNFVKSFLSAPILQVKGGYGIQEKFGIWMKRPMENRYHIGRFNNSTTIHHDYMIGRLRHNPEIMRNQKNRRVRDGTQAGSP